MTIAPFDFSEYKPEEPSKPATKEAPEKPRIVLTLYNSPVRIENFDDSVERAARLKRRSEDWDVR